MTTRLHLPKSSTATAHHTKAGTPIFVKALGESGGVGEFEAFVSVFDNRDHYGDIVRKAAYLETIATSKAAGGWPVVFAHQHSNPDAVLGKTSDAREVYPGDALIPADATPELKAGGGLWVAGGIEGVKEAGSFAAKLWAKMVAGLIKQWSFAYDVLEGGEIQTDGRWSYELRKMAVLEIGPCLFGVNSATMTIAAKARASGRPELAKAIEAIDAVAAGQALDLPLDLDAALGELEALTVEAPAKSADPVAGLTRDDITSAIAAGFEKAVAAMGAAAAGAPATATTADPASAETANELVGVFATILELENVDA